MLITAPGDIDLEVRPGTAAAAVIAAAGLDRAWCGPVELDPDHPAGVAPLVHGARLTAAPSEACLTPPGPHLHVVEGPDAGHLAALIRPVLVGRGDGADLRLDDPAVSAEHALVTGTDRVRVRDQRSANGTAAPRWRRLRHGETFEVGRSRILVTDPAAAPTEPRAAASPSPAAGASRRWGALAAGIATGVTLAAVTGRWLFAAVGLLPAAAQLLVGLRSHRQVRVEDVGSPAGGAVAVRGDPDSARGLVRAMLVERGRRAHDGEWDEPWMRWLGPPQAEDRIVIIPADSPWPSWSGVRVEAFPDRRVEDRGRGPRTLPPLAYSIAAADVAARRLASAIPEEALPRSLRWGDLAAPRDAGSWRAKDSRDEAPPRGPRRVRAIMGECATGAFALDLDADGPHVLIAGTTGAGKSVALETLVSALAVDLSPSDLTLALIDFKGGAGLRACMDLPHVAATLTDLDGALARRAIAGLTHELAERKAALRTRKFASLVEWEAAAGDAPPRLVVVIDEYQEIVSSHPSFLPDLARIAAQGRSLGLHLILATQRPAGAVTPEVRANVSTTIALRVASAAESRDLLGVADASKISSATPGRAVVAQGTRHTAVQLAAPSAERSPGVSLAGAATPLGTPLARVAADHWRGHHRAAPLWRPPLPSRWEPPRGDTTSIPVAWVDVPERREQWPALWDPREGPLLVVGAARSGRSSALRSISAHARDVGLEPVWLPSDPRLASRTLFLASARPDVVLVIDDVAATLTRLATVDDGVAAEDLARRPALRLPTAMAGDPTTPTRFAATASVLAVCGVADAGVAAQWGVPRGLTELSGAPGPGRAVMRHRGVWNDAQLAASDAATPRAWVAPLPSTVDGRELDRRGTGAVLGTGGDAATPIPMPTGPVTVVAPPGSARDLVLRRLGDREVRAVELPALVPAGTATVVLAEPTPRAVRALAPFGWRGLTDPVPVPGRVVLVHDGVALAVQIPTA